MSFGPAIPGGPITAADFPKNFVIPKVTTPAAAPNTSPLIKTVVNNNTTFAPINITNANPGVLTLGGGGGGGVSIVQTVQNTNNVSTSQMITNTNTNTTSNNFSNQVTNTISNIANTLTGGSGTIGPATITPAPVVINVPSTTVTPTVTPSQTTQQTATPTQTASAGTGGGGTDYIMLLIVGAVVLGAVYFLFKGKGKKNGQ
jgi:uncharacterized protein HemX